MPETVPGVTFSDDGVCSFCQTYAEDEVIGKEALDKIVEDSKKRKGGEYDCVVPLSGGRDSSYLVYYASQVLGLKALAVNYNNEFRTQDAVRNMDTVCGACNVDLVSIGSKRDSAQKIIKYNMNSSDLARCFGICRACTHGYTSVVYREAIQRKIPLILWGDSEFEKTKDLVKTAEKNSGVKKSVFGKYFKSDYYKYEKAFWQQRKEFAVPGNSLFNRTPTLRDTNISDVHVFDYIRWDRNEIKENIIRLGWRKPEGGISTWRTDCQLIPVVHFLFHKIHGASKACFGWCKMVKSGQMAREDALRQEEELLATVATEEVAREVLEKLVGMTRKEADRIIYAKGNY